VHRHEREGVMVELFWLILMFRQKELWRLNVNMLKPAVFSSIGTHGFRRLDAILHHTQLLRLIWIACSIINFQASLLQGCYGCAEPQVRDFGNRFPSPELLADYIRLSSSFGFLMVNAMGLNFSLFTAPNVFQFCRRFRSCASRSSIWQSNHYRRPVLMLSHERSPYTFRASSLVWTRLSYQNSHTGSRFPLFLSIFKDEQLWTKRRISFSNFNMHFHNFFYLS
jgi:hypothetical protein